MKKIAILLSLVFMASVDLIGQAQGAFDDINESSFTQDLAGTIDTAFMKLQARPPIEKLYLQLDKPRYHSGGTIWFNGYLVTATGHTPFAWSKFIYVELFDKSDSLICRKKIKEQDGVFSGNIKLDTELPDGDYFIRAYSLWMLNSGMDFLFRKTIHIDNLQPSPIHSHIEYQNGEDGSTNAAISFFNSEGEPVDKTRVKCSLSLKGEKQKVFYRNTGLDGKIEFDYRNGDEAIENQSIEVTFEGSAKSYTHQFFIPAADKKDFDVQFFPEGGELIVGSLNKVAFKAIAQDGYSTTVSGFVVCNETDTVAAIKSRHLGFGSFNLVPEKGKKYNAIVTDSEGVTKRFSLPQGVLEGAALAISHHDGSLRLSVRANGNSLPKPYYILAHSCENILFTQLVDRLRYSIPTEALPDGLIHFVLVDGKKRPVSSRMVFIKKENPVSVFVQPNKENYGKREAVSLSVSLQQKDTLLRSGNFSLSVTDDQVVRIDSLADNICSNLLLTSDLKGHIEDPAFYFLNNADTTNRYLDLLMLTQGWQRFKIENVLENKFPKPNYLLEMGQTISGKYKKDLLNKKRETEITALSTNPLISVSTKADKDGYFIFDDLDFTDSTTFTIQAQRYTKIREEPAGRFILEKDTFPSFAHTRFIQEKLNPMYGAYLNRAKERMYYEGSGRVILLEEFMVKGVDKRKNYAVKYGMSSTVMDEDAIAKKFPTTRTLDFVVKTLPGVRVSGEQIYFSGKTAPVEILLDDMPVQPYELSIINSNDIATIVTINGAGAALYSRGGGGIGGVILIKHKEGGSFIRELKGIEQYMPLGYQKPVEFYVPKYEIDSVHHSKDRDMRTTIYWNPKIKLDAAGKATVNFYTADPYTTYSYILEGVTSFGEVCRFSGKLRREEE